MVKTIVLAVLACVFAWSCCRSTGAAPDTEADGKHILHVAVAEDIPHRLVVGGQVYSFHEDMLRRFAAAMWLDVRFKHELSLPPAQRFAAGGADALVTGRIPPGAQQRAVPLYDTGYAILCSRRQADSFRREARLSLTGALEGKRLAVTAGFRGTQSCDRLLDSLSGTGIRVSSAGGYRLAGELSEGKCDLAVCEKSEAQLACALYTDIRQVYEFGEEVPVWLVFAPGDEALAVGFRRWLEEYRRSEEYAMLNYLYFERGYIGQHLRRSPRNNRVVGGISVWDDLFKAVCGKEGQDWLMLSAIAYHESRFDRNVVSCRGAQGLMQIMPVVAEEFGMEDRDLADPETNVLLAARLLHRIEQILSFSDSVPYTDRMCLILASYNCGIGHVTEARRLARLYGDNPDSWEDVSHYLERKGDRQFVSEHRLQSGLFRGYGQTRSFVDSVMKRYRGYCEALAHP